MPRTSARFRPQAAALESRLVLSTVLTPAAYEAARGRIVQAVARFAATGNEAQSDVALARAVRTIPAGAALLPTLDAALEAGRARPRAAAVVADVNGFLRDRIATGEIAVPNPALRRKLGLVAPSPPPVVVGSPPPATPRPPGPTAPPAAPPASFTVGVRNSTTSALDVQFTQVVNGVRTQLTDVAIRARTTAPFVGVVRQNSSPITVSAQSPSVGYWEVVAPAEFSQLDITYMNGRCYFYFN